MYTYTHTIYIRSQETFDATARFIDALKIPYIGPSLGGVETLVEQVVSARI